MSVSTFLAPTWHTEPDYDFTLGGEVADLCTEAGFPPDGPQRMILDATFAMKDGKPASFEVAVVGPRQNLKTGVLKQIGLGWSFLLERELVVWSAHEVSTSTKSFADLLSMFEEVPFLERRIKRLYRPEGRERIELHSDRPGLTPSIRFKARTRSGGRGLTGDDTILDEAFALKPSHLGALIPIMLTRSQAQVIYASSAGLPESESLRSIRDRGRRGDARLAYFEWGDTRPREGCTLLDCDHAVSRAGCALDDRSRWWSTNPALGVRITEEAIADARRAMPPEEFAREILGWWDDPGDSESPFPLDEWQSTADHLGAALELEGLRLAVDMPHDRRSTSVVACGRRPDGVPQIEVVAVRPGVDWVVPLLADLKRRRRPREVVIDGAGAAASLIPGLELDGHRVTTTSARDMAAACGSMYDAVHVGPTAVRHVPHDELTHAVLGARRRALGDAWALDKKNAAVDISPLVGAVLAHWAVTRTRPRKSDAELLEGLG